MMKGDNRKGIFSCTEKRIACVDVVSVRKKVQIRLRQSLPDALRPRKPETR